MTSFTNTDSSTASKNAAADTQKQHLNETRLAGSPRGSLPYSSDERREYRTRDRRA
jgi:hypothetical protein